MANQLKMAKVNAILSLHQQGWSQRKIAEELNVNRETVAKYLAAAEAAQAEVRSGPGSSKPATAPPGSEPSKPATAPPGSDEAKSAAEPCGSTAADSPPEPPAEPLGWAASRSDCATYRERIQEKLELGLTAKRIHQDLVDEFGFEGSYWSVRRFVRRLSQGKPLPFRRLETTPGEEAQVDFGTGARVRQAEGRTKKTHVFRIVLSHSRKAYSEVVYRQTTENFIRCLENAFWHFGGVPKTLVIDNLRAAVKKVDWFEPELNPKVESFCAHYGVVILPTRPRMPRHKGKVEKGIDYVQDNGLKGRQFESLEQQNRHLLDWEMTVADTRIHGTTRQQVAKLFREVEQTALQRLPTERFPFFHEGQRSVHRDGHVEVDKAYYSAPPEYVGCDVWARWDGRLVRIFNERMEQIAIHAKRSPGGFSTHDSHLADEKIATVERGATWLLSKVARIGPHTENWAVNMIQERGIAGVRVLQGLLSLTKQHTSREIEDACEIAVSYGAYKLRNVRRLIERKAAKQEQLEFMEEHPIIRNLEVYGELVRSAFHPSSSTFSMEGEAL